MHRRVQVEVEWFIALSDAGFGVRCCPPPRARGCAKLVKKFSPADAEAIKAIERTTNHDVKAVEYWIKQSFAGVPELEAASEFVHFACTSEDINNTSHALMLKAARDEVMLPAPTPSSRSCAAWPTRWPTCRCSAAPTARRPARPPWAREIANVVARLLARASALPASAAGQDERCRGQLQRPPVRLAQARPGGLQQARDREAAEADLQPYTIQIEPHDYMAELFDAFTRANTILVDWSRDVWGYISLGYFKQKTKAGEIGSSTMPHKVNPIDFENAEGNFGLASAVLTHLAQSCPSAAGSVT